MCPVLAGLFVSGSKSIFLLQILLEKNLCIEMDWFFTQFWGRRGLAVKHILLLLVFCRVPF